MYLRTVEEQYFHRRWNTQQVRHKDVFACDECDKEYVLGHKASHATLNVLTFCSRECNRKTRSSGKLAERWKATKLERYGVEHSSQVAGAAEKMIKTRTERTGAAGPADPTSSSNAQFKVTMLERHGSEQPSRAEGVKRKKLATYRERYGVDNPLSTGSKFRSQEGCIRGGQVGYRALIQKRGDAAISRPEAMMASLLRDRYGADNVEQQVEIYHEGRKPWLIDFRVTSSEVYVQVDGVFWHGLDAPYDQLHESKRVQYDRDREQDQWFQARGMRLVRVTDMEIMNPDARPTILARLEG
jgi:very-short-patch-repair endonuclease